MFNTYARVCIDASDDEDATAVLRETAGGPAARVDTVVVTSTGAVKGRSQQAVQQRKGSGVPAPTTTVVSSQHASNSTGNLIDLADDTEPRPAAAPHVGAKARGRHAAPPQQVELVTFGHSDPFDQLVQRTPSNPQPPAYAGAAARGSGSADGGAGGAAGGRQGQHPLDFGPLQPPELDPFDRATSHAAASSSSGGRNGGGGGFGGGFPMFGSFSDLLGVQGSTAAQPTHGSGGRGVAHPYGPGMPHSHSTNGIADLLEQQRVAREVEHAAPHFDPFNPQPHPRGAPPADPGGAGAEAPEASAASASGAAAMDGGGVGTTMGARELLLYAVPLLKDRLVFLPVVNWKDEADTSTVLGKVSAGVSSVGAGLTSMWHGLKDKGKLPAKIYAAGQAILENMNAEERLMRNIPRKANKLVVHHPSTIPPDEIQDQLTALTSTFCYKSVGKAAASTLLLPVAVGLEVIAVPGIGWYTAYQLFKSTSAAAGGSRLNNYLKADKAEVRVCYSPCPKMDIFILKARLAPDGVLGGEDIEDLCHELREPALLHPLQELRSRHLRKTQTMNADYALLPMNAPEAEEGYGSGGAKKRE